MKKFKIRATQYLLIGGKLFRRSVISLSLGCVKESEQRKFKKIYSLTNVIITWEEGHSTIES